GGLTNFVQFLQGGGTVEQVAAGIAGSPEYFRVRGGGSNDGFLNALYQDLLNRTPDAGGRPRFDQVLLHGGPPAVVAGVVLGSPEFEQDLVEGFYQQFLHRPADSGGLAGLAGALSHGATDEEVTAAVVGSEEYFAQV